MEQNFWRKCSVCKKEILFNSIYYVCSVTSCNKKRAPTQFCSVTCWDSHRAVMNHMSAGADEERSPSKESVVDESRPRRKLIVSQKSLHSQSTDEILVVVSKLKSYIKEKSDMNTSQDVMPVLSALLRDECDKAIDRARLSGRKTVMARDFDSF